MSQPSESVRGAIGYCGRPTDARGLLPIDVARKLLDETTVYPGAPVHEGRTPDEAKRVAVSHDLHAALVSLGDAQELVDRLLRLTIAYPPLYDACPFVDRFGDAILPWLAGQVHEGCLDSKTWGIEP